MPDLRNSPQMPNEAGNRKRVVISGAGPAGLLTAGLLLERNNEQGPVTYEVTLVDGRDDYGAFSKEELQKNHRSWMLGLADHGMDAIKTLPDLYENYVKGEGIRVKKFNMYLGKKKYGGDASSDETVENFIVDRNFIVAALAKFVKETHTKNENYTALYNTKCLYVDYENKRMLVRDVKTNVE